MCALKCSSCWPGPTSSTWALINNARNFSRLGPININTKYCIIAIFLLLARRLDVRYNQIRVKSGELWWSHICELIDSLLISLGIIAVVFEYCCDVVYEDYFPILLFAFKNIVLLIFLFVRLEINFSLVEIIDC